MIISGIWAWLNVAAIGVILCVVLIKLVVLHELYNWLEKIGLGWVGAGCMMTFMVIIEGPESPFYQWAGTLFMTGTASYFTGRLVKQAMTYRGLRAARKMGLSKAVPQPCPKMSAMAARFDERVGQ